MPRCQQWKPWVGLDVQTGIWITTYYRLVNFMKLRALQRSTLHKCQGLQPQKTEEVVKQARPTRTPKKTQIDTRYCIRIWKSWSEHRNSVEKNELVPEDITTLDCEQLQYWLSRFVLEVRKKSGLEYPPNTLHHIRCGLLRHLKEMWKTTD